jgi:HEAT repeat protein
MPDRSERDAYYEEYERVKRLERDERVDDLIKELQNPRTYRSLTVRGAAAMSLERLRAKAAARPIAALLEDADNGVRQHAIVALGRIGPQDESISQRLLAIADDEGEDEGARTHAIAALAELGELQLIPRISSFLASESRFVRDAAFYAALMLGGPQADAAVGQYARGWRGHRRRARVQRVIDRFQRRWRS